MLANFTVASLADDGSSGTLRATIDQLNLSSDPSNTIQFQESLFASGPGTIKLLDGQLGINKPVTINGPGADLLTIDACSKSRIFYINDSDSSSNILVTIAGLTLMGGKVNGSSTGGAIHSRENLTLIDSVVTGNSAGSHGGGIYQHGSDGSQLTITNSTISNNRTRYSSRHGGGIYHRTTYNSDNGKVTITGSLIIGNVAKQGSGGGIFSQFLPGGNNQFVNSGVFISSTKIIDNDAGKDGGGAFVNLGGQGPGTHRTANGLQFEMTKSVVSGGNEAQNRGGGLYLYGAAGTTLAVRDSLVTGNQTGSPDAPNTPHFTTGYNPDSGGGIYAYLFSGDNGIYNHSLFAHLTISGTTVSDNSARQHGGGIFLCNKRQDTDFAVRNRFSVYNATITGNSAGVLDEDPVTPGNQTVDGKGGGVAIAIFQMLAGEEEGVDSRFTNVTVTDNEATLAGGIFSDRPIPGHAARITDTWLNNTIVSANRHLNGAADNLWGSFNFAESYGNLLGDNVVNGDPGGRVFAPNGADSGFFLSSLGNSFNNNPQLAPLADNGGLTPTHAPFIGSPALDTGWNSRAVIPFTSTGLTVDHRGYSRYVDNASTSSHQGLVDRGAYEYGLIVTVAQDQSNGNYARTDLSIREALVLASALQGLNQIEFNPGTFASNDTITLLSGALLVNSDVEIVGLGADGLTINANGGFPSGVFQVVSGANSATFRDLTVTGANGWAISKTYYGGSPVITLDGVRVMGNVGGISLAYGGTLTVSNSEISNNTGTNYGGISLAYSGPLLIQNSTIAENSGVGIGLGYASGTIVNSTVSENEVTGTSAAGLSVSFGSVTLVNSTVAFNRSDKNNTSGNSSATGGLFAGNAGTITMHNTIAAGNVAGAVGYEVARDLGRVTAPPYPGTFHSSSSYNLIGADPNSAFGTVTGPGNIVGVSNPGLAPLDDYGGLTRTHALTPISPAIDKGSDVVTVNNGLVADQRGFDRIVNDRSTANGTGGTTDIGAFEFKAPIIVSTLADESDGNYGPDDLGLREALVLAAMIPAINPIVFDPCLLIDGQATITLTMPFPNGPLQLNSDVQILGLGADRLTIDANHNSANAIQIVPGATNVTIKDLRVTGANSTAISKASPFGGNTTIVVDGVHITGNGGGISATYNVISFTISNSEIANNTGLGISAVYGAGPLIIKNSTIAENQGGGIGLGYASATILNSTISENETTGSATAGLSVSFGSVTLVNSTVAFNRADKNNMSGSSSATAGLFAGNAGSITLHNSIVASNVAGAVGFEVARDLGRVTAPPYPGTFNTASSFNLIGADPDNAFAGVTGQGNMVGVSDPGLAALDDYGGPTRTHALLFYSPAIDQGDNSVAMAFGLDCDQRGFDRFVDWFGFLGEQVDIGAVELAFDEFYS